MCYNFTDDLLEENFEKLGEMVHFPKRFQVYLIG